MLKEGQEAHVAAGSNAFEERDVPVPGVQLQHVIENIGHGFPGQEQIDKFLLMREGAGWSQGDWQQGKGWRRKESKEGERLESGL